MSAVGRRTRSASRQGSDDLSEGLSTPPPRNRRARGGSQGSTGMTPRPSGAFGGPAKPATAEKSSAGQGQSGFASAFGGAFGGSGGDAPDRRLTPIRESPAERPASPVAIPDRGDTPEVRVVSPTPSSAHGSKGASWILRILFAIMTILTIGLLVNASLSSLGLITTRPHPTLGSAPAYEELAKRLESDLFTRISSRLLKSSFTANPSKPPSTLNLGDVPDHNQLSLHYPDHFAYARGAVVNPTLTSTTQHLSSEQKLTRKNARKAMSYFNPAKYVGSFFLRPRTRSPVSALTPWQEAGDCWCAKQATPFNHWDSDPRRKVQQAERDVDTAYFASHGGIADHNGVSTQGSPRAQLTVLMPADIYPTHAIIEHISPHGTTDIASAPEWLDIYAEIPDAAAARRVWEAYARASGEDPSRRPLPEYSDLEIAFWKQYVTRNSAHLGHFLWSVARIPLRFLMPDDIVSAGNLALGHNWVRVARYRYDIHGRHVKVVKIPVEFRELGVSVRQMSVRVRSNWGREYTCLYRVRMLGESAEESG